jgi:hypothetical protein
MLLPFSNPKYFCCRFHGVTMLIHCAAIMLRGGGGGWESVTSRLNEKNVCVGGGGGGAESHISASNSTTAVILVSCNKVSRSSTLQMNYFYLFLHWVIIVGLIMQQSPIWFWVIFMILFNMTGSRGVV